MANWRQYFQSENWLTLDQVKGELKFKVVGWGVATNNDRPQPYLLCENHSGERLRVRVNATSFADISAKWGDDPEAYIGKVIAVSRGRVKTRRGWTEAMIVQPTDETWEDIPF
jgi:hypothetical protein